MSQVQKLLGKGSYGIVYRVKRLSDGGVYALKEADVRKMSPLERADAVNEIRLLASVKHQNVVRYHEAFLDGECRFAAVSSSSCVIEIAEYQVDACLRVI